MILLLIAQLALTNADLRKHFVVPPASADVYDALKQREYHAPPTPAEPGGCTCVVSSEPRVRQQLPRRLDGTLLSMPPIIYGVFYGSSNVFVHPYHNEEHHGTHRAANVPVYRRVR
jgi:hypothetical protein